MYPPRSCYTPAVPDGRKWLFFDNVSFIQNSKLEYADYHKRTCTELHCHSSKWGRKEKSKAVTAGIEFRILFIFTKVSYVKEQDDHSLLPPLCYKRDHSAFIMLSFSHPCQHILWYTFLLVTEFTYWWFGVVLSQVIPSEVQDNTGDNIEKPGKTPECLK